jgi:enoyl-[acyl-carrier protein] reductase III
MSGGSLAATFDFSGRRALVTGGTRGFGALLSKRLAEHGAHVYLNYVRDDDSAKRTLEEIEQAGGSGTLVKANLVHAAEIDAMFEIVTAGGHLDILVHNAALGTFKPTLDVRANQWDLTMSVNVRALLLCSKRAVPLMAGRSGRIVSISSLGSQKVLPSYGAIGTSKAALEALTRYLAMELKSKDIRVNAVSAGPLPNTSLALHPEYEALAAQARETGAADAEEVAAAVLFLCSDAARGIVGQTMVVDGGFGLSM